MKITIFLALALAVGVFVARAEPLHKENAQGYVLEQEQDTGLRLKRASCSTDRCSAICGTRGKKAVCVKGICKCI